MSDFKVQVQNLYGIMDLTEQLESALQQAADSVRSVKRNLRAQIRQRERIDSRLDSAMQQLEERRQAIGRIVNAGRQAAELYKNTEQDLLGLHAGANVGEDDADSEKPPFDLEDLFSQKNLWKLIGKVGVVGSTAKAINSFANGEVLGGVNDLTKVVGSCTKLVGESGNIEWGALIGLTTKYKPKPKNFGDAFSQQLKKYKIGKGQSMSKNISAAAKWAGDIVTVAETGVANWNEFKDDGGLANPDFYAETAIESTLKISTGIAVSAAVTAIAGTPVGWAGLAVGVAAAATTVAVNWALDGVSKLITGNDKGWVENVSDGVVKLSKAMGDGVVNAGKSIAKWWGNLWS